MQLRCPGQPLGDRVERVVPRDRHERAAPLALVADPPQRHRQPLGVVLPFGIARDLGADDAARVGLPRGAAHPAEPHPPASAGAGLMRSTSSAQALGQSCGQTV